MPIYLNKEDNNMVVHLGCGDVGVGTACPRSNMIVLHPIEGKHNPGDYLEEHEGLDLSEIPAGLRLIITNLASAEVLMYALQRVIFELQRRQWESPKEEDENV